MIITLSSLIWRKEDSTCLSMFYFVCLHHKQRGIIYVGFLADTAVKNSCFRGQKFTDKRDRSRDYPHVRNTDAWSTNKEHYAVQLCFSRSVHVCVRASNSLTLSSPLFSITTLSSVCCLCTYPLLPKDSPFSCLMKHLFFFVPPLLAVFFNQISTAHSVLFHFLMTVQRVSLNELTRVLLVTPRHSHRQMYPRKCLSDFSTS